MDGAARDSEGVYRLDIRIERERDAPFDCDVVEVHGRIILMIL